MERRSPVIEQIGTMTVYTIPRTKERRALDRVSMLERERQAWEVMLLVRPFATSRVIHWRTST